ncbi:MAG: proteasome assembly chaperone family protein [Thermoplasmata archaeon]|nr:MAG: proteasome assembly chaperone family protein [Thermoplasmata archaeon]
MADEIDVRRLKEMSLENGTIMAAFPTVHIISAIAAGFLIDTLKLDQICALDSNDFPPISMIYAKKPKFPARVYASEEHNIALFVSEFSPKPKVCRPLGRLILTWAKEQNCKKIISLEGLPTDKKIDGEPKVVGIGSTDSARKELEEHGIEQIELGMTVGVTAVLLNEGRWEDINVISLIGESQRDIPDARVAASLVRAVDKLFPAVKFDMSPLDKMVVEIEKRIKQVRSQAEPVIKPPAELMYR